ncbi:hypothetical protein [Chelatococcus sp. GCM10030263]
MIETDAIHVPVGDIGLPKLFHASTKPARICCRQSMQMGATHGAS